MAAGGPIWGVRLDSGDLAALARQVRAILNEAGMGEAKIMVSGDLTESRVLELVASGAPIDAFGVGTDLATSADAPNLGVVYKLVEIQSGGTTRQTFKRSAEKATRPGAKQVFRHADHDLVGCAWECVGCGDVGPVEALLRPAVIKGQVLGCVPTAAQARERARSAIAALPESVQSEYPVRISAALRELSEKANT